jgi:hypothetical protein
MGDEDRAQLIERLEAAKRDLRSSTKYSHSHS